MPSTRSRRRGVINSAAATSNVLDINSASGWGADLGYDAEFDLVTTSLPTGWSWMNQGSSTFTEKFGSGVIASPGESGTHWRGLKRNVPTESTWEAVFKRNFQGVFANDFGAGVFLRAADGKLLTCYIYYNSGAITHFLTYWTDADGSGASVKAGPIAVSGMPSSLPNFFRLRRNNANSYDFAVSNDGILFTLISTAYDVGALFTPETMGVAAYCSSTAPFEQGIEWVRVRALGWTPVSP